MRRFMRHAITALTMIHLAMIQQKLGFTRVFLYMQLFFTGHHHTAGCFILCLPLPLPPPFFFSFFLAGSLSFSLSLSIYHLSDPLSVE